MNNARRTFLRNSSALAAAPMALNLAGIGQAAAQSAGTDQDYKALVCLFLFGGNDHGNTLIPADTASFAGYRKARGNLAYFWDTPQIGLDSAPMPITNRAGTPLSNINTVRNLVMTPRADRPVNPNMQGRQFSLAPPMAGLLPKFNSGKLAVMLNVGPLVEPITAAEYNNNRTGIRNGVARQIKIPPQIGSHNDQTAYWQSGAIEGGATTGWGGQMADAVVDSFNSGSPFTCMSLQGNTVFLSGNSALQYQVSRDGPVRFSPLRDSIFGSASCADALGRIATGMMPMANLLASDHAAVTGRAIEIGDALQSALDANSLTPSSALLNSTGDLGKQLAMVARIIKASASGLGVRRQVFFVGIGGFDTHSDLATTHPALIKNVADAMVAFHDQTVAMGMGANVTTFTASEFGRQFVSNGDGSDHGWGGMHFVLGDAVQGGALYGKPPSFVSDSPNSFTNSDHLFGTGFLVPTMPVEKIMAPLAQWMGVTDPAQLQQMFPNLSNFSATPDLGFI